MALNHRSAHTVLDLLQLLEQLQSDGSSIYPAGIFPSQRYHPFLPYRREDDNLFFSASVAHLLLQLEDRLNPDERNKAQQIVSRIRSAYPKFRNKDGADSYNFWQTRPGRHFPNGLLMHRFKHFQIPDDVDDTALVYLTEPCTDKDRVLTLREKLKHHANLAYKRAFNPLPKYRDLRCYSTFLGERMYIEFDICVLSNLMRLILSHVAPSELNPYDLDTLEFITSALESNEHVSLPFRTAPNYPTSELIVYHVARAMHLFPPEHRERIGAKLRSDCVKMLKKARGMNRILLENAALHMSLPIVPEDQPDPDVLNDESFFFFHAGMITAFENPVAQRFAHFPWFHLRYASKALNGALLIENIVRKRGLTP